MVTRHSLSLIFDTREPDPHPWSAHLPEGWRIEHGTLETGDHALARIPEGVVIERKTPSDLAGCIGASRERFERELRRGRYVGRFLIVVEGSLADVQRAAQSIISETNNQQ
jgi:ERCC4-type nuclease